MSSSSSSSSSSVSGNEKPVFADPNQARLQLLRDQLNGTIADELAADHNLLSLVRTPASRKRGNSESKTPSKRSKVSSTSSTAAAQTATSDSIPAETKNKAGKLVTKLRDDAFDVFNGILAEAKFGGKYGGVMNEITGNLTQLRKWFDDDKSMPLARCFGAAVTAVLKRVFKDTWDVGQRERCSNGQCSEREMEELVCIDKARMLRNTILTLLMQNIAAERINQQEYERTQRIGQIQTPRVLVPSQVQVLLGYLVVRMPFETHTDDPVGKSICFACSTALRARKTVSYVFKRCNSVDACVDVSQLDDGDRAVISLCSACGEQAESLRFLLDLFVTVEEKAKSLPTKSNLTEFINSFHQLPDYSRDQLRDRIQRSLEDVYLMFGQFLMDSIEEDNVRAMAPIFRDLYKRDDPRCNPSKKQVMPLTPEMDALIQVTEEQGSLAQFLNDFYPIYSQHRLQDKM